MTAGGVGIRPFLQPLDGVRVQVHASHLDIVECSGSLQGLNGAHRCVIVQVPNAVELRSREARQEVLCHCHTFFPCLADPLLGQEFYAKFVDTLAHTFGTAFVD